MPAHPSNPRLHALLPCAGTGSRAGTAGPKQYEPLAGRPLVQHTLAALAAVPRLATVLVVVAPDDAVLRDGPGWTVARCGGATRAATVGNGLAELLRRGADADDWVLVHDAARCLLTPALVERLVDACLPDAVGGLLAQPLADTLKDEAGGRVAATVPRAGKWLAQTPQMFRIGLLQRALAQAGDAVTDEASAVEALGLAPLLVPGSALNFKVTWPEDFALAEAVLAGRT
jgi:2-C-methyl-D-erythritol 4-phosphate cytidylyltransferase